MHLKTRLTLLALSAMLAACGTKNSSPTLPTSAAPGTLLFSNPLRVASLTAADFQTQATANGGGALFTLPGVTTTYNTPKCGIDIHYLQYGTVGGAGEPTTATGALMIPTGGAGCTGPRPIVLYAHGTTTSKNYNIADITDPSNPAAGELGLVAALFAAQGYIVVAPNYAGYDKSALSYHPYLNAQQQSTEMINILTAARTALPNTPAGASTSDSGQLFVTGYSQGGHVAMATLQAMQKQGIPVTAGVTMSGPYSMSLFGDSIFGGNVIVGGTLFTPLLSTSYQMAYGNVYNSVTDLYNPLYANGIASLLPGSLSETQLFSEGKLPQSALFQQDPGGAYAGLDSISPASAAFAFGFDPTNYLVQTSYRAGYLADAESNPDQTTAHTGYMPPTPTSTTFPLRKDLILNDLRSPANYVNPSMPVMMCGGGMDPTVQFQPNTTVMDGLFAAAGVSTFAELDVDATANNTQGPKTFTSTGLTALQAGTMAAYAQGAQEIFAGGAANYTPGTAAFEENYHGTFVPPACTFAARAFFQQFQQQ